MAKEKVDGKRKFVYKIRLKGTELYSTGGEKPRFVAGGKTWSTLGQLRGHLAMFIRTYYSGPRRGQTVNEIPLNWEVVAVKVVTTPDNTFDARTFYEEGKKK